MTIADELGVVMDLDPELLRAFVAVRQTGGFTGAAKLLNRTQSTVSHQIRRLEGRMRTRLIDRTTRKVALTPQGDRFYEYASRIIALMDEVDHTLTSPKAVRRLRLGIADSPRSGHAIRLLAEFAGARPNVEFHIRTGMSEDLRAAVAAGELDVAIVASLLTDGGGQALWREPFVWVAAEGVELSKKAPIPVAACAAPCLNRRAAEEACRRSGTPWKEVLTCASQTGVVAAIASGLAVAVLPRGEVAPGMRMVGEREGLPALADGLFELAYNPCSMDSTSNGVIRFLDAELSRTSTNYESAFPPLPIRRGCGRLSV